MKLSTELQPVLLELANIQRSEGHEKENPEQKELEKAQAQHTRLIDAAGSAQMAVDDMEAEILRIQSDERKLRKRVRDDKAQLGAATDKETRRDLEHDMYAAKSRIADLMSELQEAHNEIHALRSNVDVCGARVSESERQIEKLRRAAEAVPEPEDLTQRVVELRGQLPDDVLDEFDAQRNENGVGAAALKGKACGGCFIVLPPAELNAARGAAAEELPQCVECGSYLIRAV